MRFIPTAALAAAFTLLSATAAMAQHAHSVLTDTTYKCGPPPSLTAGNVPLWPGVTGTVTPEFPITTHGAQQDSVRAYFNQGVAWMYGYNFGEAVLSFRKAAQFDPDCAICFWGVATSLGANINEPINAQRWTMAMAETDSARMRIRGASPLEQALIRSARTRFVPDSPINPDTLTPLQLATARAELDRRYADTLRVLWRKNPRVLTLGTMAAEAQLNLHPWDWYDSQGRPKWPATRNAVALAGEVLRVDPHHVGAAHIWIHALEASRHPDRAYPQAVFLQTMMPGSAHLTHMPSHIFHRVGEFRRSVDHNTHATVMDQEYLRVRGWEWRYPMYYAHDNDFLWISATFAGMRSSAAMSADSLMSITSPQLLKCYPNAQHFLTAPSLVAMRFGDWDRVLSIPSSFATYQLPYPHGMWHYTRGWAFLRTNQPAAARASLDSVYAIARNASPRDSVVNNSTKALLRIAGLILSGEILASQTHYNAALDSLRLAVHKQDSLNYDEPPPFFYPARHSLGAVLLERSTRADLREAALVYRTDLGLTEGNLFFVNRNRQNGWAYRGMVRTMRAMGRDTTFWSNRFKAVWDPNTPVPPSSRY